MDIENILEKEKMKALHVIKEYNIRYKTDDNTKLIELLNYLYSKLECEKNVNIKIIIQDDINTIKEYL
jgi:predicted double-glycine peptidase